MKQKNTPADDLALRRRRKISDLLGGGGMILVAVGMLIPLFNLLDTALLPVCKWIFTAGALMFTSSKCIKTAPEGASFRLRRLKRLEFWAGVCFLIAAGFWWWNERKYNSSPFAGTLSIIHDTILFTLSGAVLQVLAAWLIYFREKKEARLAADADADAGEETNPKK